MFQRQLGYVLVSDADEGYSSDLHIDGVVNRKRRLIEGLRTKTRSVR